MSGEYRPSDKEWELWFAGKPDLAIEQYIKRPKFAIDRDSKQYLFKEIPNFSDDPAEIKKWFVGWEQKAKQTYQLRLGNRYLIILNRLLGEK